MDTGEGRRPGQPNSESAARPAEGPNSAWIDCGPYRREAELRGLGEREITRATFLAFAALVDEPETDSEELPEFLSVTVRETGQLWIYPTEVFLQNLADRRGDQAKSRRALERLLRQEQVPQGRDGGSEVP